MRAILLASLLALALPLAGCLGKEDAPAETVEEAGVAPDVGNVTAAAPVELAIATSGVYPANPGFDPATLEVASGASVTLTLTNAEPLPLVPHNWVLEGVEGAATDAVGPGESGSITFTAPAPGEYTYFCSVGDHRDRGMVGTLTVS